LLFGINKNTDKTYQCCACDYSPKHWLSIKGRIRAAKAKENGNYQSEPLTTLFLSLLAFNNGAF